MVSEPFSKLQAKCLTRGSFFLGLFDAEEGEGVGGGDGSDDGREAWVEEDVQRGVGL